MVKKEWNVPVSWQIAGVKKIEANTLEEAMLKVKYEDGSMSLPDEQIYIDGSFELSYDVNEVEFVREYENNGQEDANENKIN